MKPKFKGTPGPWERDVRDIYPAESDYEIAIVYDGKDTSILNLDKEVAEANARLIAAAPELLEALRKTNELLKDLDNTHTGDNRYADFAIQYSENRKLIEKALGI